jgi:hypothetical protein
MVVRKVRDLEGGLSEAERRVLDGLGSGAQILVGLDVPAAAEPSRQVRAALIRLLLLRDDDDYPLHEKGLQIVGAWIPDQLDLEGCHLSGDLLLGRCRFSKVPNFRAAQVGDLFLSESVMPGLIADRIVARGDLFLRSVDAFGEVRLIGAKFGGNLDCDGAKLRANSVNHSTPGCALAADNLRVAGNVFLRSAEANGAVRLLGAVLGGDLDCTGATFRTATGAQDRFPAALALDGIRVTGRLLLRGGARVIGLLDMSTASLGSLNDDSRCWPVRGHLNLNDCRYGSFSGLHVPTDAKARLDWLHLQDPTRWGEVFWPQPYEQLAKVLREMGHGDEARVVLIEKEERQRAANRAKLRGIRRAVLASRDALLGVTVRYGHRPLRAFVWLLLFFLFGWSVFQTTLDNGAIKPNVPVMLHSAEWYSCGHPGDEPIFNDVEQVRGVGRQMPGQSQLDCFLAQPEAASYPRFDAMIYSLDTLLPIVSLEMQGYWIPDESNGGARARIYLWFHIGVGWALSLLAVAGFSGLVKSD